MHLSSVKSGLLALACCGLVGLPAANAADGKEPITFLAAVIQSGPFKVTDSQNLEGIKFALKELNAGGGVDGHPIELKVIDTELNAAATRRKSGYASTA